MGEANARGFIARSHEPGIRRWSRSRAGRVLAARVHAQPRYFAKAGDFRRWLAKNAATAPFLVVGFMKRGTGVPSMTWPQSVDEALCVGWIDGVRQRIDAERYKIRFSPRKPGSTWSTVNIARATALLGEGRLTPAGMAAFGRRIARKSGIYAYEQETEPELNLAEARQLAGNKAARSFLEAQAPSYRRKVIWWVVSARQQATRNRRFAALLAAAAGGRRL